MALVIVTRKINRFSRSVNGAWVGAGTDLSTFVVEEAAIDKHFSIGHGIEVEWGDGTKEHAFPFNGGACPGYPHTFIPANGRLSKLFAN